METLLCPWQELQRVTQDWRLSVVAPPGELPVTVADLKVQARILFPGATDPFGGAEDDLLTTYLEAAVQQLDAPRGWLGRSLVTQTLRLSLDAAPPRIVRLPAPPVQSITQIAYTDPDGVDQVIASGDLADEGFEWDLEDTAEPALIWNDDWPDTESDRPGRIRIDYVAGYGAAAAVPSLYKHWILCRAAEMYRDREASSLNATVTSLEHVERALDNHRVRWVA